MTQLASPGSASGSSIPLGLRLRSEANVVVLEVTNPGPGRIRLWRQENGWGWPMPGIRLGRPGEGMPLRLRPRERLWTRDFPTFLELEAGDRTRYRLEGVDLTPDGPAAAFDLHGERLEVQGELSCEPSPESEKYGVWCGTARSEPEVLLPPHPWLSAAATGGEAS